MSNLKITLMLHVLFISIIAVNFISSTSLEEVAVEPTANNHLAAVLDEIKIFNILSHMQNLSSIPTRVTGYPGCNQAAQYIIEQFHKLGLKVEIQEYPILVPVDHGANITVLQNGNVYKAYPLWPNMVQCSPTPSGGITGYLIYAGSGSLEEFDGLEVAGSIVLMEFNSMFNWINAAKLGAKAVIFIEPEETTRMEAESKVILTPIYFPRVYVTSDVGRALKELAEKNTTVNLKSRVAYEWRTAKNIIGVLEGEVDDQIVILAAHYDSWSPVPSLAPDAFDAVQTASLLEIARIISADKPLRTVWFLALSGRYQSIAGAREFVEKYYFQNETYRSGQKKILAFADLQLSTDSPFMTYGSAIDHPILQGWNDVNSLIYNRYFPALSKTLNLKIEDYVKPPLSRGAFEINCFNPSINSEPVAHASGLGFSYITMRTLIKDFMTPINKIDKIDLSLFDIPIKFILYTFNGIVNDDLRNFNDLSWFSPRRYFRGGDSNNAGIVTLNGRVDKFNYTTGFYEPVPNALVVIHRYDSAFAAPIHGVLKERHHPIWGYIIVKSDENGTFTVHCLEHTAAQPSYRFNVLAFVVDPNTGEITHAPELGVYGGGGGVMGGYAFLVIELFGHPYFLKTVVFECKSLTLFDLFDPYSIVSPRKRLNVLLLERDLPNIALNEFASHTLPISWGMVSPIDTGEPLAMVFVPPETTVEVVLLGRLGGSMFPVGVLNNASEANPLGTGISESGILPLTAFRFLDGIYWIVESRHSTLLGYHVLDITASEWHHKSRELIMEAKEALSNRQYSRAYGLLYNAWNMEINSYRKITSMSKDVINTSLAFYLILFPFAFLLEFLVFMKGGKRRLINIVIVFIAFIVLAYFIHPGFRLASNFWGCFLGLSVLFAAMVVVGVIAIESITFGKRLRAILTGLHYTEISRTGALLAAFSVGVQNMRKRRLRTLLTITSILLLTASFVALTSAFSFTFVRTPTAKGETIYHGMLLTRSEGYVPFKSDFLTFISSMLPEAEVFPRAWFFPALSEGARPGGFVYSANGSHIVEAVVGLTVDEAGLTNIDKTLLEGLWFTKDNIYTCILPKPVADDLSVQVGDQVVFLGVKYQVTGIADDNMLKSIVDLNQESLRPKFELSEEADRLGVFEVYYGTQRFPIPWDRVLIMPYSVVRNILDGDIYTIAVAYDDEAAVNAAASRIMLGSWGLLEANVGYNGKVTVYRRALGFTVSGSQFLTIPFAIATLVIFTTILGSIYERMGEIAIYSSVGLSPLHVAAMFFAESITYAVMGGVLGYLVGVVGIDILLVVGGIPPELNLNLSSSIVFITVGISFLATILASIYPSIKASRLVTPSLERKWKIRTKPLGDEWTIPLPFFASTQEETRGIMVFVKEFLDLHLSHEVGIFWVKEPVEFEEALEKEERRNAVSTTVALSPWDAGFTEQFRLTATKKGDKPFAFEVNLKYLGGERHPWTDRNPDFVNLIRKQLLLWRGLKQEEKDSYIRRGEEAHKSAKSTQA